jgi:hypothetical protein
MADDQAPEQIESTSYARFAPEQLRPQLDAVAPMEKLAVIIDVDVLDPRTFTRGGRVMTLALDALSQTRVHAVAR